jgi:hypothetical protein
MAGDSAPSRVPKSFTFPDILLLRTPDEMRGRASAVKGMFISASNELGGFESGLAASLLGPVIAVVGGGVCTILAAILVAKTWPEMRQLRTLSAREFDSR